MNADHPVGIAETVKCTEYGIPIRNIWYMLSYAWRELRLVAYSSLADIEDAPTLDALLAIILMKLVRQRLRIGLGCSYVDEQRSLRGIRGRIDFAASLKNRIFERGQAFCEYEQYSANAPKNQIIRSTLARLVQLGQFGANHALAQDLRHNLRRLTRTLDGIDLIELKPEIIRRQQLGRNDGDYRLMVAICDLILQRQLPSESVRHHRLPELNRDALVFHRIYERFVANFYQVHLKDWTVSTHKRIGWHEKYPNPLLPAMEPDLVLQQKSSGRIIVLDTKFTARCLVENRWGKQVFDSSHLYQLYAYLKTQEHLSEQYQLAAGMLLYPAIRPELSETVELQYHTIRIECVDLAAPWQEIEQRLLGIILDDSKN